LNKKVINIGYSLEEPDKKIKITCVDSSSFEADHVIITTSLGVLKAHHQTLFTPQLPEKKISVIESFGYGAIGKIFFEFSEPFWDESFVAYSLLWNEKDVNEIQSSEKTWLLDIVSFIKVDSYPNLLEAFVAGERMKIFEELSDEKIIYDSMWLLQKFLNRKLPIPVKIIRTKWLTSENFLGSYSYISVDMEKFNYGPKDLAEPIKKSNGKSILHFAGEATDLKFPSYAHGAVTSGRRAADEIIEIYKE
jgi:monoamine oxidase